MIFNSHSYLAGQHAYISASKNSWRNYDDEKFERVYIAAQAARRGDELHDLASNLIRLGVRLEDVEQTLNMYVNDAIGYRMTPEQTLYYSENAFGTADAISFRKNLLRVHDLKTGVIETNVHQLEVYAAFFCLEYRYKPVDIEMEFRIYQNNEIRAYEGDADVVTHLMSQIVHFDKVIKNLREEAKQ